MSDKIIMPKRLTAENGAKAIFIGEFYEEVEKKCPHCHYDSLGGGVGCDFCEGEGVYVEKIPVSWTTIKEIYKRAVSELGERINDKN